MDKKKSPILLMFLLFLAVFSLRMIHLSADPPENLSASAGPYGDPGGYAFNARNKLLFGTWEIDKFNPMYHTIIPHFATYLTFKLFGIGIAQMNAVPVLFSCLVLISTFWLILKAYTPSLARLAVYLLGINYIFIMFSRVGNRIMPMLFFVGLTLFFLQLGTKKPGWNYIAGVSTLLAFITKGVGFYILAACAAGLIVYNLFQPDFRKRLLSLGLYFSGIVSALIPWVLLIYLPYGYVLRSISGINIQFLVPPKSLTRMAEYFWTRPPLVFQNMPLISLLAGLAFLIMLYRLCHRPKQLTLLDWILLFWYAGSYLYFAIIYQRVTRHFVPLALALSLLVIKLIYEILQPFSIQRPKKVSPLFGGALFLFLLFPTSWWLKPVLTQLASSLTRVWTATALLGIVSLGITVISLWLIRAWPFKLNIIFSASQKKGIVILLLVGITIIQGQKYLAWALHPQYKLRQISEDLGKAFDQAAISGLWAPVLCLENKHRAYESYPSFINDNEDFLEQYKITHVIATDFFGGLEKNYYWNNFAEEMQKSKLLVKYPIWRGAAFLYDLHPDSETAPQENIMEAEMFTQSPGMPRYDPESSGQFAVSFQKGTPGFLSIASSGRKFTQGSHQATFRLKIEGNKGHEVQRIARIDVISSEQNRVLAVKNLMAADFSQEDTYQEFNLTFTLKRPAILDFRVYSDSVIPLWADNFRIETTSTQNVMKNR